MALICRRLVSVTIQLEHVELTQPCLKSRNGKSVLLLRRKTISLIPKIRLSGEVLENICRCCTYVG